MEIRLRRAARPAVALLGLYIGTAGLLLLALPGHHGQFECMVIGTGAAGITVFALFAFIMRKRGN